MYNNKKITLYNYKLISFEKNKKLVHILLIKSNLTYIIFCVYVRIKYINLC